MKPKNEPSEEPKDKIDKLANNLPFLALPNEEKKIEPKKEEVVDDMMNLLEAMAPSKHPQQSIKRSRSRSVERKKRRSRSRDRPRSRSRERKRSRSRERKRSRSRDRKRSRSRDRSKRSKHKHRRRSPSSETEDRSRSRRQKTSEAPADPEPGHIYDGKVQNITGFGCFVALDGFRRKVEGLVHISQLSRHGRVEKVDDVVTR